MPALERSTAEKGKGRSGFAADLEDEARSAEMSGGRSGTGSGAPSGARSGARSGGRSGEPSGAVAQSAGEIARLVEAYVREHPSARLIEDGRVLFDLRRARFAVETERERCTLHVWSEEANLFRRVVSASARRDGLRLEVSRLGQKRPQTMELRDEGERRLPGTRETTRARYLRVLDRVLTKAFPEERREGFRTAMDLERSFGPAYARGTTVRGRTAWAVVAVNGAESQATIDGVLTIGILWLAHCREQAKGRTLYQGLRVIVPKGSAATTASRMAWMDRGCGGWELYELEEREEELTARDPDDSGNLLTRLVHAPDEAGAQERFADGIARVVALLPENADRWAMPAGLLERRSAHRREDAGDAPGPEWEMRLRSSAELVFLRHGLEFARVRAAYRGQSFNRELEVTVGAGVNETVLSAANEAAMRAAVREMFARRRPGGDGRDALFRMQPERWLESVVRADVTALDAHLRASPVYTQVPALTGAGRTSERGLLDLLAVTEDDRLAVIELKAEEDLHLALQGLDYWIRVRFHQRANMDAGGLGDLQRHGYFARVRISSEAPRLYLAGPALRIHPATETILRHFDRRVEWTLIALDERWRTRIRPVWRRRSGEGRGI